MPEQPDPPELKLHEPLPPVPRRAPARRASRTVLVTRGPASLVSVIGIAVGVVVVVGGPADVWVEEGEELENALVGARQAEQAAEAMADEAERLAAGLEPLTAAVLRGVQRAMR